MSTFLVATIDGAFVLLSWTLAIHIRALFGETPPDIPTSLKFGILLGSLTITIFSRFGFYEDSVLRSLTARPYGILRGLIASLFLFILFNYFFGLERLSRATLLLYLPISFFLVYIFRLCYSKFLRKTIKDILLVGGGEPLKEYLDRILNLPNLGFRPMGWYDPPEWAKQYSIPTVGEEIVNQPKPSAYVISYSAEQSKNIDTFVRDFYNDVTRIYILPTFNSYALLGVYLEQIAGVSILSINQPRHAAIDLAIKRTIDLLGSVILIIFLSPFLTFIALAIRLTSQGQIFYSQERIGLDGLTFKMWKFRTMINTNDAPQWTVADDPRRTALGAFLRKTSMDELPQLWNVFIGQMSLVGPRPEQPFFVGNFRKEIPAYMLRHKMKAGITGWAQVNGWRGNTCLHKRIECDIYYIKNWSLWLDLKILCLTLFRGFFHKNAY